MSKMDRFNDWLTLIANIGVVLGLIAVVMELRHSSQVAEVEAYQSRISEIQEINLELALSNELPLLLEKFDTQGADSLSPVERRRVRAWYNVILRQMQGQYFQYQNGFLERQVVENSLSYISKTLYAKWEVLGLLCY